MTTSGALAGLVGRCEAMVELRERIARLGPSELRVHVYGETGTGKERVARALHECSARSRRPFVPVNVAGFPDELLTAELFGHGRGAFTGAVSARDGFVALAEGGTLFIDEVGEIPLRAQVRLLRFLEEREYQRLGETSTRRADVRVISATNVDLAERVGAGTFRKDLLFRLKEDRLLVPPLRERGRDVLVLARHFLRGPGAPWLGPEAESVLVRHPWPGNVRELENEMRRLCVLAAGREVLAADLSPEIQPRLPRPAGTLSAAKKKLESELVWSALERNHGVQARAAAELGITRQALCVKLRRLGLAPAEARPTWEGA